jgi:hypothetical protein
LWKNQSQENGNTTESTRIKIESVEFQVPVSQNISLEEEELNRGTEELELLSVGQLRLEGQSGKRRLHV